MIRRPTRSTRTDTLFPYTALFRSLSGRDAANGDAARGTTLPSDEVQCLLHEPQKLAVVDVMRFPGGVGVVVEVVRVFDQVSEFVGVGPVEDLIGRTQPLDAQVTEGPQQHSRREMLRIGYAQKGQIGRAHV